MGGLLVNQLQLLTSPLSAPLPQVSPQHPPLWKPHQYVHREARDPPSYLLCLHGEPPESPILNPGCSQLYSMGSDLGTYFCGGGRDAAGVRQPDLDMPDTDGRRVGSRGKIKSGLLFPKALVWLRTACTRGWEGEGGRRGGTFEGLEPEFLLSGTVCFSKT